MKETTDLQQHELERLREEVHVLRKRVYQNQRLSSVGTMTAMVIHEFNNILTPIMNYAQLAKCDPRYVPKAIDSAIDGGGRATEICRAILSFSKETAGRGECFRVCDVVNDTLKAMIGDRICDAIEFVCDIPTDIEVVAPKVELQQVILNLLINARAAVLKKPQPRKIEITSQVESRRVMLRVSDNGVGIPPENLKKVFEPFFTTKTHESDGLGGSGLGLSISFEIMRSIGGKISVESTPGVGTSFALNIPMAA